MAGLFHPDTLSVPIVQAPMAGGPSTPELAIAVSEAGALGFLAAGYRQTQGVREEIDAVRAASSRPFGVNLFVPTPEPADPASYSDYLRELESEAARQGVELDEARFDDDEWERKLQLVRDRAAARRRGDADAFNLWAGQAHELAEARPAGELVRALRADTRRAVDEAGRESAIEVDESQGQRADASTLKSPPNELPRVCSGAACLPAGNAS